MLGKKVLKEVIRGQIIKTLESLDEIWILFVSLCLLIGVHVLVRPQLFGMYKSTA